VEEWQRENHQITSNAANSSTVIKDERERSFANGTLGGFALGCERFFGRGWVQRLNVAGRCVRETLQLTDR